MINKYALGLLLTGLPLESFAGDLLEKTFQHGGLTREYEIYLPDDLPENAPLVFVLHGRTSRNEWVRGHSQMNTVADKNGFAVCYPQGTSAKMPGVDDKPRPHWNVHLSYMKVDDVGFLSGLAEFLQVEHTLDSERTFVAGHSNGGHMAYALAVERPEVFKAVASIAGWMSYDAWQNRNDAKPIPIMQIHGLADPVNPIEGYGGDPNRRGLGWGGAIHVDEVVKFWVQLNECSEKTIDILTPKTTAYRYTGGINNHEVWYYKIADWPHIWPANGYNPNNVSKEGIINGSEEIWKFFSKFPVQPSSTVEASLALLPKPQLDSRAEGPRFPNVITLLVDDLGYRDIGCYGGPVKTPVLDKLAAEGVRFIDFHSGAPVCSPSRATFLTGRNHIRAGVYSVLNEQRHRMHLLRSETTLAEVLKDAGYGTAHFGKWHLGMPINNRDNPTPAEHGFDYWFGLVNGANPTHKDPTNFLRNGKPVGPMKGYSCQLVVDEAIDWLDKKRDASEPFFLNLWFNEPHAVIAAPDEIVSRYGALNNQAAIYNGTIDNTDRAIGRLIAKLEQIGELDNTIIHYSSDNGSYRQDRCGKLRGKKGSHYEGGHRVPGIFYWKGKIPGGHVEKEAAGAVDLLPTICGLLGIDKPKGVFLDGSDLTPLLIRNGSFERHQPLFWMNGSTMVLRMGAHTLLAPSTARLPFDNAKAKRLLEQTKLALGDDLEKELGGLDLRTRMFNGRFVNREANRLRDEFRAMFHFNEALIPQMKKGGVDRVQLYDLSKDLKQQNDIAKKRPKLVARMKKQANLIYKSVMADAPEWLTPEEQAVAKKPRGNGPQRPATGAPDTDAAKLLASIDKNNLPEGYHASSHQPYVDKVTAGLKPEQRARVGQLWKEKRRLDPSMPNRGSSYVKILTHVAGETAKSSQPNVVILLADDLGSKDLGCYGGPVKTPVLDGLAAKGVRFTDFHAGAAVCTPSRATLLTGRQNLRTGIYGVLQDHMHDMHLLEREVTIAEVLKKAGYGTAHFGKWHVGMTSGKRKKPSLHDHGFDYWFGLSNGANPSHRNPTNFMRNGKRVGPMKGYSSQIVVSDAINWLETKANTDQPFFMNIWFNEPHSKLAAPDEIISIYGDLKDEAAIYSATVDNTDRAIGRLVAKLKETGKLDNTLIIYSSDNGSYRADRNGGLTGNKGSNFQGGLRSPGIFFWPDGIRGGRIESTPSGAVDLLPTICGLAGIDKPKGVHLDGADLSPLLIEKGTFKRSQPMFWLAPSSGHLATLREENYTLMGYRGYKLPSNQARKNELLQEMARLAGIDPSTPNLGSRVSNTTFTSPEYKRLKNEFVRLRTFQEAWIPIIKEGGFSRFALYDLKADPLQKKDISKQRPEVTNRLKKKLLTLYKDVMADAPDWPSK